MWQVSSAHCCCFLWGLPRVCLSNHWSLFLMTSTQADIKQSQNTNLMPLMQPLPITLRSGHTVLIVSILFALSKHYRVDGLLWIQFFSYPLLAVSSMGGHPSHPAPVSLTPRNLLLNEVSTSHTFKFSLFRNSWFILLQSACLHLTCLCSLHTVWKARI